MTATSPTATEIGRTAEPAADPEGAPSRNGTRLDIQALRAVAVLAVVIYHLWPNRLPGGFVGVDIFFVISGFLITSHLLKSPPRRARDFGRFWARRIQRLIPPVVVVIAFTLVCVLAVFPSALWRQLATESIASMFYFENWKLIADATDYLNAEGAPSPFQHFWSLSVEEQYYIVWPLLIGLLVAAAARVTKSSRRTVIVLGVALVVVTSFIVGLQMTSTNPAQAYFATYARMWELGIGSLLAAAAPYLSRLRASSGARIALMVGGYAGIVAALFVIDEQTPFPGWIAILPTVATAAVIAAEDPAFRLNPRWLLHARPAQVVGDISYALYLWHWPLLITAGHALDRRLGHLDLLVVLGLSVLAGWLSTRFVETPVRQTKALKNRAGRVFGVGAVASLVILAFAVSITMRVDSTQAATQQDVVEQLSSNEECFGAGAADPAHSCPPDPALVTTPEFAKTDTSRGIKECLNWPPFDDLVTCDGGVSSEEATAKVALFGDSHAGQWLPALEAISEDRAWDLDTYIVGICQPSAAQQQFPSGMGGLDAEELTDKCTDYIGDIVDEITGGGYDLVVMAAFDREPNRVAAYAAVISEIADAGIEVAVMRDTPAPMDPSNLTPDCVAANIGAPQACDGTPTGWIGPDAMADAALELGNTNVRLIGLNHFLCNDQVCPATVGGVIAYSDSNHLTQTMVLTLRPYLEDALVPLVD